MNNIISLTLTWIIITLFLNTSALTTEENPLREAPLSSLHYPSAEIPADLKNLDQETQLTRTALYVDPILILIAVPYAYYYMGHIPRESRNKIISGITLITTALGITTWLFAIINYYTCIRYKDSYAYITLKKKLLPLLETTFSSLSSIKDESSATSYAYDLFNTKWPITSAVKHAKNLLSTCSILQSDIQSQLATLQDKNHEQAFIELLNCTEDIYPMLEKSINHLTSLNAYKKEQDEQQSKNYHKALARLILTIIFFMLSKT